VTGIGGEYGGSTPPFWPVEDVVSVLNNKYPEYQFDTIDSGRGDV
jgi:hypothetical protein